MVEGRDGVVLMEREKGKKRGTDRVEEGGRRDGVVVMEREVGGERKIKLSCANI